MNKEKTTFIRATLNNSLENLKQTGIPINRLSQVKIIYSNGAINYDIGSVKEEIQLYVINSNPGIALDDNKIQKKQDILVQDAKMIALCLAYLPLYGKGSKQEQLFANEWRRLEREITLQELKQMQAY
jgi:hypothetical protein